LSRPDKSNEPAISSHETVRGFIEGEL
jgi:hypothetical protein